MPSDTDASISLAGVGLISTCLENALAKVEGPPKEDSSPPALQVDLKFFESGSVMEAFGEAILHSQKDGAENNLHASLRGSGETFYNRVGQNWRFLGGEEFVLKEAKHPEDERISKGGLGLDDEAGPGSADIISFAGRRTQILAYNDQQ